MLVSGSAATVLLKVRLVNNGMQRGSMYFYYTSIVLHMSPMADHY
jgi:hypothetical protein